jgi:hypothetical protein
MSTRRLDPACDACGGELRLIVEIPQHAAGAAGLQIYECAKCKEIKLVENVILARLGELE